MCKHCLLWLQWHGSHWTRQKKTMFYNVPVMIISSSQARKVVPKTCMTDKQGSVENTLAGWLFAGSHFLPLAYALALCRFSRNPHFRVCSWNDIRYFCLSWKVKNSYDPQTSFICLLKFWKQNSRDFPQNELCRSYDKMRFHLLLRDSPLKNVIRYSFPDINNH